MDAWRVPASMVKGREFQPFTLKGTVGTLADSGPDPHLQLLKVPGLGRKSSPPREKP